MDKFLPVAAIVIALGVGFVAINKDAVSGAMGPQGPKGEQGVAGKDGRNGVDGKNGRDGKDATVFGGASETHTNPEYFYQPVTLGGNVFATTSQGAATYVAGTLTNTSLIYHTASAALTATLPASSTLSNFAPRPGDVRTIYLAPVTTGITLAGGTGTDLDSASSTKFCVAATLCRLDFVRKSTRDFEVLMTSGL